MKYTILTFVVLLMDVQANHESDPICFNIFLFSNYTLAQCNSAYTQYLNGAEASIFCGGSCPKSLAQAYRDCGYTTTAENITTECAKDSMDRYCGDMARNQTFNIEVQNMISTCDGATDCTGECQTVVQRVGCCANLFPNVTESNIPGLCTVEGCSPIPINKPGTTPQGCVNEEIEADSTLQDCYDDFVSAAAMAMGESEPTRVFCSGNVCPRMVSKAYATCGLSAHSTLVQKGCSLDEMDRYCGNVVDRLITPEWTNLVSMAIANCAGTDCTNSTCKATIDMLGCCVALGVEVNGAQLPLNQCGVDFCPTTFDLTDGATTFSPTTLLLFLSTLIMTYSCT